MQEEQSFENNPEIDNELSDLNLENLDTIKVLF